MSFEQQWNIFVSQILIWVHPDASEHKKKSPQMRVMIMNTMDFWKYVTLKLDVNEYILVAMKFTCNFTVR